MNKDIACSYKMPSKAVQEICKKIKLIVSDFDGVMTDNKVWINSKGEESVLCSRADGWAVKIMERMNLKVACLTTDPSNVVAARCHKIGIRYYYSDEKGMFLKKIITKEFRVPLNEIAFVGNDTNDLPAMQIAALSIAPQDAAPEILEIAMWRTVSRGGEGVLREIAWALSKIL